MKKLSQTKKITKATFKSFVKRNAENLHTNEKSSFDGMTDMCEARNGGFSKVTVDLEKLDGKRVLDGVYLVGRSNDYFTIYEDETYYGIEVYNCCGTSIVAVKK